MSSDGLFEPTPAAAIDAAVEEASSIADAWASFSPADRALLAGRSLVDLSRLGEEWVSASLTAKGMARGGMGEAEEWLLLATALRSARQLRATLRALAADGRPPLRRLRRLHGGQVAIEAFPASRLDRVVYRGMAGEVWLEPGVEPDSAVARARRVTRGEVAAVLGAGNASMLPVVDVLHQLVVEGRAVVLKPNPVNAYLGPLIERGLGAFVRAGALRLIYGGAEEGARLCTHAAVEAVHLTGSAATYRAISGLLEEEERPLHVTAELGNVSPVIVVPGPWSRRDVERQAERIATWLAGNAGFGCLTPRVLVQHREWPQREALLGALERALARVKTRPAYYPGAETRFARFTGAHPETRLLGAGGDGRLPWALIPDLDPGATDDVCFREEAFCGLIAETSLPAPDAAAFLEEAVRFANGTLWGTLVATLLVHPASLADPALVAAVDGAVAHLRYGTVTVNSAAFAAYHTQVLPWGAHPAGEGEELESGLGRTANGLLLGSVQKSVLRGPFVDRPDPFRATAPRAHAAARRLAGYEATGSARVLPGLAAAAVRGGLRVPREAAP